MFINLRRNWCLIFFFLNYGVFDCMVEFFCWLMCVGYFIYVEVEFEGCYSIFLCLVKLIINILFKCSKRL